MWKYGKQSVLLMRRRRNLCSSSFSSSSSSWSHPNWERVSDASIPELSARALQLKHRRTGASYVHIKRADPLNSFAVVFRTPAQSSAGVTHILEHTVLCGSEKFPVRDPFFNMLKRSLNTFMNAMTAADHTLYPFSTTNQKDFRNLMQVYLDATFHPLLKRHDFQQEGHRLEVTQENTDNEELVYKGVVYNEMKGVLADGNNLFMTRMQQHLFPGTNYANVSGGDPEHIPELTYEQLVEYHKKHYHPSNALFYSYGDLPLEDHLAYLDDEILSKFDHQPESAQIGSKYIQRMNAEKLINATVDIEAPMDGISTDDEKQAKLCLSMLIGESDDVYENFCMRILSYLLLNGTSAPMYQGLIESNLASDYSGGTGFDSSAKDTTFGIGVEGISQSQFPEILLKIQHILRDVATNGFDPERITAVLHQIELGQKHIAGNFGINILQSVSSTWCHNGNPIDQLKINEQIIRLNTDLSKNPKFFESLIEKHLLQNCHSLVAKMIPKKDFVQEQEEKVKARLDALKRTLSRSDIDEILKNQIELKENQEKPQDLSVLPSLSVKDDISKELIFHNSTILGDNKIMWNMDKTNEISYCRVAFDSSHLSEDLKPYLPFFCSIFSQLGNASYTNHQLSVATDKTCGGFSCVNVTHNNLSNLDERPTQYLTVETMCLPHQLDRTFKLLSDIIMSTDFFDSSNIKQIEQLLNSSASNAASAIAPSGNRFAALYASSSLTPASYYNEMMNGFYQVQLLQNLNKKNQTMEVAEKLHLISQALFKSSNLKTSIVTESKLKNRVEDAFMGNFYNNLSNESSKPTSFVGINRNMIPYVNKNFFSLPLSVNFVVNSLKTVPFLHSDHVPLAVLTQILSSCYLHQEVREKGGAYGCGVSQGDGVLTFSSYYDPHTLNTVDAYLSSFEWAKRGDFSEQDIDEALLSLFGSIDSPQPPSAKGKMYFLYGITDEIRQKRRDQYLSITKDDIVAAAEKYLNLTAESEDLKMSIVGSETNSELLNGNGWNIKSFTDF